MPLNPSAGLTKETYTPDQLLTGDTSRTLAEKVTLLTGENRTRGAVLGRTATAGTVVAAVAGAGNTGNGTVSAPTLGATAKEGVYRLVCVEPVTNLGTFAVEDPDGVIVGRAIVGAAFAGPIGFTISDGATDFVAGDFFTVAVSAITYKYKLATAAAADGSNVPVAILAQDCDASAADKEALVYVRGDFNDTQLTLGAGLTVAGIREGLRLRGIALIPATA